MKSTRIVFEPNLDEDDGVFYAEQYVVACTSAPLAESDALHEELFRACVPDERVAYDNALFAGYILQRVYSAEQIEEPVTAQEGELASWMDPQQKVLVANSPAEAVYRMMRDLYERAKQVFGREEMEPVRLMLTYWVPPDRERPDLEDFEPCV